MGGEIVRFAKPMLVEPSGGAPTFAATHIESVDQVGPLYRVTWANDGRDGSAPGSISMMMSPEALRQLLNGLELAERIAAGKSADIVELPPRG
jgi:hypothetical protein